MLNKKNIYLADLSVNFFTDSCGSERSDLDFSYIRFLLGQKVFYPCCMYTTELEGLCFRTDGLSRGAIFDGHGDMVLESLNDRGSGPLFPTKVFHENSIFNYRGLGNKCGVIERFNELKNRKLDLPVVYLGGV